MIPAAGGSGAWGAGGRAEVACRDGEMGGGDCLGGGRRGFMGGWSVPCCGCEDGERDCGGGGDGGAGGEPDGG